LLAGGTLAAIFLAAGVGTANALVVIDPEKPDVYDGVNPGDPGLPANATAGFPVPNSDSSNSATANGGNGAAGSPGNGGLGGGALGQAETIIASGLASAAGTANGGA
jgi:hypothetical protein